ncbi:Alpha-D-ribose 1-methylphosphonate 5-triphosphate synthase subunit PhnG [Methylobacterium bullatum]|uniref:Alpha-D-ribose 1-methylphosphonate 5-triphosphate synthase subunit PhnG n=2 Tax=Methylobacteriaceae TaxID=119045 RepID=A0AAV4ZA06_9HYPH|nr:Alpha-D-ribose 1-methylphosphonate 5-triphosphate synthase subunit PhnG [Methylobacterium bullatum]
MPSASQTPPEPGMPDPAARRHAMERAGQASPAELLAALVQAGITPEAEDLRPAETGLVMVRGRIGGDGRPFNAGEATVTRAAVRLPGGETGFAYHLGRDRDRARLAAILDAHWQRPETRPVLDAALAAIAARRAEAARQAARKVAATRVNFFTLARGED